MGDVIFLAIILASFGLLYVFVVLCDRIIGVDEEESTAEDQRVAEQVAA